MCRRYRINASIFHNTILMDSGICLLMCIAAPGLIIYELWLIFGLIIGGLVLFLLVSWIVAFLPQRGMDWFSITTEGLVIYKKKNSIMNIAWNSVQSVSTKYIYPMMGLFLTVNHDNGELNISINKKMQADIVEKCNVERIKNSIANLHFGRFRL